MEKIASRINWENEPSTNTPINEENLNKMDIEINTLDDRVILLDTKKANESDVLQLVSDVAFDENTGIITITKKNGSVITIDTKMEKIAVNFEYDTVAQQIILTLIDGTKQYIDLSALITQYEFLDSDTITFVVQSDGKIKAEIPDGSITENKLQPNYLAEIKVESANASLSATNAKTSETNSLASATLSESYAVGGTGIRGDLENTDNAKYYNEQAQKALESIQAAQVTGVKGNNETEYRKGNVNLTAENIGAVAIGGDTAENIVSFTSTDATGPTEYTDVELLASGEKNSSLFAKISTMFKNIRYMYKMLGTTDISAIGDGTVTGGIREINSNLDDFQKSFLLKLKTKTVSVNAGNTSKDLFKYTATEDGIFNLTAIVQLNASLNSDYAFSVAIVKNNILTLHDRKSCLNSSSSNYTSMQYIDYVRKGDVIKIQVNQNYSSDLNFIGTLCCNKDL